MTLVSANLSPKRTLVPVRAIAMELSSDSTQYYLSTPIRFWLRGNTDRISFNRFSRCGGKDSVMLTMSMTHPRRNWKFDHVYSPDNSFLSNKTSLRVFKSTD